ncbi:MAG: NADH-quinone oxidoreductase subunit J [bacterium]
MISTYLSYIFGIVAVVAALSTVLQKNPVYSAASLIIVMLSLAVNYLLLNAEFIAAIQVIVYAGAIMVMFVFVIMFLNVGETANIKPTWSSGRVWGGFLTAVILVQLFLAIQTVRTNIEPGDMLSEELKGLDSTRMIGKVLFSDFLLPFELVSVVLIVGVVGAVVLGKSKD